MGSEEALTYVRFNVSFCKHLKPELKTLHMCPHTYLRKLKHAWREDEVTAVANVSLVALDIVPGTPVALHPRTNFRDPFFIIRYYTAFVSCEKSYEGYE